MLKDKNNKVRCIVCNYFDALNNCKHCEKCLKVELQQIVVEVSDKNLFGAKKNFLNEVN